MTSISTEGGARIALVTCAEYPELAADDRLVLPALARRGARTEAVVWNDADVDWTGYDLVVIRSAWDYTERYAEFAAWLDRLEQLEVPLWNPPGLLRWNSDKRYLRALAEAGVATVPTRWLEPGEDTALRSVLEEAGWARAVVKPVVSANARDTWTTSIETALHDEERFQALRARGPLMVQPFVAEIEDEGEWSLVFLGGQLSHAVLKRPASGDFRVQEGHGGTTRPATPDLATVYAALDALAAVPYPWLYARVDGVRVAGAFQLMELELLEPSLFLVADPEGAPERLADAILAGLCAEVAGP